MSSYGTQMPPLDPERPETPPDRGEGGASGPRAGFWRRFAAFIVDGIILSIVDLILAAILGRAAYYGLSTVVAWAYGTILEGGPRGQTVGKMALGIRVFDFRAGGSIGYGRALIRQIVKVVSAIPIFLGYFWMLWDREKQCWHDKAATDVVVPVQHYPV